MAMGADLGRAYGPAVPSQPKPKSPERNDYDVEVMFYKVQEPYESVRVLNYVNVTKSEIIKVMNKLTEGFTEDSDGVLHNYTKFNILHICAKQRGSQSNTDTLGEKKEI